MFDKIVQSWTEFVHKYPVLAYTDIASVVAFLAYMVLA